jgi:hypothetical protein
MGPIIFYFYIFLSIKYGLLLVLLFVDLVCLGYMNQNLDVVVQRNDQRTITIITLPNFSSCNIFMPRLLVVAVHAYTA